MITTRKKQIVLGALVFGLWWGNTARADMSHTPQTRAIAATSSFSPEEVDALVTKVSGRLRKEFPRLRVTQDRQAVTFSGRVPSRAAFEQIARLAKLLGDRLSLVTIVDVRYPQQGS
jgi:hypothetical protein